MQTRFLIPMLVLLISSQVLAQMPPAPAAPATPLISTNSTVAQYPVPAAPLDPDQTILQFPNAQISDILDAYERLSGKRVIRDANITFTLSINAPNPLPKTEAIQMIESTLLLNGYVFVSLNDKTVKIINVGASSAPGGMGGGGGAVFIKNPRSEGIAVYTDLNALPPGEIVASYFLKLNILSPAEAIAILQQHVQLHTYGSMVPVPNAQALLITENSSLIRSIMKTMPLVDVPPTQLVSEFVTLTRANSDRVALLVTNLLSHRSQTQGTTTPQQPNQPNQPNQPRPQQPGNNQQSGQAQSASSAAATTASLIAGDATLISDPRTNRILISTRPINLPYLKQLIEQFDQSVALTDPYERPLKYVAAADILPVIKDFLIDADTSSVQQRDTATTANNANTRNSTSPVSSNSRSGNISTSNLLLDPTTDMTPQSIVVGSTRVIADKRTNSILILGLPESVDKVKSLLDHLDKRPMQVYFSTAIGQLALTNDSETGIDILQKYGSKQGFGLASGLRTRSDATAVGATTTPSASPDPGSLMSAAAFPTPLSAGLNLYGQLGKSIDAYVKLLADTTRYTILGRPTIYTSNNKRAVILSGQQIAVPQESLSTASSTTTTASVSTSIVYKNVVLQLEVIPLINADKEVTLTIAQENDTVQGSQTIDGNTVPTIGSQFVQTTITVPNKTTIVLGGLITTKDTSSETGIPFLKDIPYLGTLFKDTTKSTERDELIVLIQPTVIDDMDTTEYAKENIPDAIVGKQTADFINEKVEKAVPVIH